jgi:hypothetical protein
MLCTLDMNSSKLHVHVVVHEALAKRVTSQGKYIYNSGRLVNNLCWWPNREKLALVCTQI